MKVKSFVFALLLFSVSAQAEVRTVTKKTGNDKVVSVGECSSPVLGTATGIYQSSVVKVVCREYVSFQADVQGTFWNKKTNEIVGAERRFEYRLEHDTVTFGNYDYGGNASTGDASADAIISIAEAGIRMAAAKSNCNNAKSVLQSVVVPVAQTKCNQQ